MWDLTSKVNSLIQQRGLLPPLVRLLFYFSFRQWIKYGLVKWGVGWKEPWTKHRVMCENALLLLAHTSMWCDGILLCKSTKVCHSCGNSKLIHLLWLWVQIKKEDRYVLHLMYNTICSIKLLFQNGRYKVLLFFNDVSTNQLN